MGYWYTKLAFNLHPQITSNSFRNPIPRTNHPFFHTIKCYVTHPRSSSAIQIQSENRHDRRLTSPFVSGGGVTRRYYCVSHSPPEPVSGIAKLKKDAATPDTPTSDVGASKISSSGGSRRVSAVHLTAHDPGLLGSAAKDLIEELSTPYPPKPATKEPSPSHTNSDGQPLSTRAKKRTSSTSAPTIRLEMGMECYKKLAFNHHHRIVSSPVCYITHPRCSGSGIRQDHRLSPFISGVARRYYRYYSPDWMTADWMTGIMAVIGSSVLFNIYIRIETVPFTNRSRFIFWSHSAEKLYGYLFLKQQQLSLLFRTQTLPATHPESVRVRLIATNIINGLQHRSKVKKAWIDVAYASHISESVTITWWDMLSEGLWDNGAGDVKWVQNCRKKGKWMKPTTKHMMIFNWEIFLLNDCTDFTSFTLPGGKIIMSTQFLKNDTTDDEIAAILAHEIAHVLARHFAEKMTINFWADKIEPILSLFGLEGQNGDSSKTESFLSFSRKVEAEADYIGLLLMACAGYNPRVAPEVYKKLDDIHGSDSQLGEFECRFAATSGEERARLLSDPKVMEEALVMYHEATAGRGD